MVNRLPRTALIRKAERWFRLRTTNPIESTFATVRLRTKVTKGPGPCASGLVMAYKLIDAALQQRSARWNGSRLKHRRRWSPPVTALIESLLYR